MEFQEWNGGANAIAGFITRILVAKSARLPFMECVQRTIERTVEAQLPATCLPAFRKLLLAVSCVPGEIVSVISVHVSFPAKNMERKKERKRRGKDTITRFTRAYKMFRKRGNAFNLKRSIALLLIALYSLLMLLQLSHLRARQG